MENMTPQKKAQETRKKYAAARKAKAQAEKDLYSKIKENMLAILDNDTATPQEKLQATAYLLELQNK